MQKSDIMARLHGPKGHVPTLFEQYVARVIVGQDYMIARLMMEIQKLMDWEKAVGCADESKHKQLNRLLDDVERELKQ